MVAGEAETKVDTQGSSAGETEIIKDYRLAYRSRQASLIGRREVMTGKAKFGIFGDGKEIPQLAMAKVFRPGDFRSGYYRDQTLMLALGELTIQQMFAQLYAHADVEAEPATAGRAMNAHFATRSLTPGGEWKNLLAIHNSSADISPTASQMPRLVGLAYASRLYRELPELQSITGFSQQGNEIAFGTIGNASTSEGMFWEAVNAIGVLRSPAIITIYDDGYGISVPNEHQMVKGNLFELLQGFQRKPDSADGYDLYTVKGWEYPALVDVYQQAAEITRREHIPAIIHVTELTQPQGHSTSGSHERYKSKARLKWEAEHDGLAKFREWIITTELLTAAELEELETEDRQQVEEIRKRAWQAYTDPILKERDQLIPLFDQLIASDGSTDQLTQIREDLFSSPQLLRRDLMSAVQQALMITRHQDFPAQQAIHAWRDEQEQVNIDRYSSHLYSETGASPLNIPGVPPHYKDPAPLIYGFEILNAFFDVVLGRDPRVIAFGEDVGQLGDVNQGFRGLQDKYGVLRVSDTGIRENTIIGQAIGMAMRGLRPIAEIQYLDYLLYALQIMADDLATVRWRTKGGQMAPVIVRTRGHRLEGVWHSGSMLAGVIHLVRGMHVLVPRNMTQAVGFYNTLLQGDDPAVVIEVLNSYRLRERRPDNIGDFSIPIGVPEVLREGSDLTMVTYGALCRIALEAGERLAQVGIDLEVIDVQTLLPFDRPGVIQESLKKTNRILFADEDVPGGTTAYMFQQVLEGQGGYYWLDSPPRTLSGKHHRPAFGSDGDYWSKPNVEQIIAIVYEMMHEADPTTFPLF